MPGRSLLPRVPFVLLLPAVAGVAAIYYGTIDDGFHYDDYHTARPWSLAELAAAATGNWDLYGIMVPLYRPLTDLWYAPRFELFGLDGAPQHLITLAGLVFCAVALGVFVRRAGGSIVTAVFATTAFAVHPSLPYA